jgi:hypothetical protein
MMHPELVAGARVSFNEKRSMGTWGAGARSALPIVGEVFQQALRIEWIDSRAEFGKPRPRPALRYDPQQEYTPWRRPEVLDGLGEKLRGMLRQAPEIRTDDAVGYSFAGCRRAQTRSVLIDTHGYQPAGAASDPRRRAAPECR